MTAISFKLTLCMLLLTTLLHVTTTTVERTQQAREYKIIRRFIEIGREQAYPEERTQEKLIYKNNSDEWRIAITEESKLKKKAEYKKTNENAKETQKKVRERLEESIKAPTTTTRVTYKDLSTEKGMQDESFETIINAEVKKSPLSEILKHQIVLDAANIDSKVHHKAHITTTTHQSLLPSNAPTNHINYTQNEELPQHSKWITQRFKRQQTALAHKTLTNSASSTSSFTTHYNPLPAVPLPPPPPFPGNFAISPFNGGAKQGISGNNILNAFAFAGIGSSLGSSAAAAHRKSSSLCGGILKSRYGSIQTPNFPHKFPTPIECVWVIDASELPITTSIGGGATTASANISIIVYLTQLYVLGGLKFSEYMYYSDDYKVPAHRAFTLTEDDVTQVAWVQFSSQYLEIRFTMESLDGTHLRALDRLLDVYGFNITYEVQQEVKTYQCNTLQCRFLGHCYAKADYSSYYCSCFPGFSGTDCGRGPLCEDPHTNICQNGGTCKHIGDAAITCHCPSGFKGTKCEIPEINEITMGCTSNTTTSDCHKECDFERANEGIIQRKASKITARNGKTRYEVTIRLGANLTAFYRNMDPERRPSDHLPSLLERHRY